MMIAAIIAMAQEIVWNAGFKNQYSIFHITVAVYKDQ